MFNEPLTVKVPVPDSWTCAKLTRGSTTASLAIKYAADGTKYVLIDIFPDTGTVTVLAK